MWWQRQQQTYTGAFFLPEKSSGIIAMGFMEVRHTTNDLTIELA